MALNVARAIQPDRKTLHARVRPARPKTWRLAALLLAAVLMASVLPAVQARASGQDQKQNLPPLEALERAHSFFAQGDYSIARNYYLEALPSFPNNFDVLKDLGYCYYVGGVQGYAEAAKYYVRAYALNPQSSEVADKLSRCYMALKNYREAAAVEMKLARLPGAPPEAWKRAAEAYEAAGDHANAAAAYLDYLQHKPGDLTARSELARLHSLNKDYAGAAAQYRMALSANPNFTPALVGMGRIYSWQGQFGKSLELYERVLHFEPDNSEALSGKAFVLLWQKQYRQALDVFRTLHRRYPQDAEVKRGLEEAQRSVEGEAFTAAQRAGTVTKLIDYYQQRVAQNPQDLEALKTLTSFNAGAKNCNESIAYGRKTLEVSHGADAAKLALARALQLCRNDEEAAVYYRQYLESHPEAEDVLYELGDALRLARRFPEALQVFQELVRVNPNNLDGQVGLAQALAATGEYDEALSRFDQVLGQKPGYYDALQGKAFVLFWKNDLQQAQSIFEALAQQNPDDPQNAEALKDISRAEEEARWSAMRPSADAAPQSWIEFYRKRLASDPKDRAAMKGLAYAEGEINDRSAAIEDYRKALELYPEDRDSKLELARLLSLDHQYPASIEIYQEVLKQDPEDPQVLESLARVYVWAGEAQPALKIYQQLAAQTSSNAAYELEVGRLDAQLKDYTAARSVLGSLLSAEPQNRDARLELARMDVSQGQLEAALQQYEALLKDNPQDPDALLGKARIAFYHGKLNEAQGAAEQAVQKRPDDFSSLFLLASIEHARHHRRKTLDLLDRADKLSPGNPDAASLRKRVLSESAVTLRTTMGYAREIGPPTEFNGRTGLANEDLRMYTYGATLGLSLFPRTNSYISYTALPSDSPPGPNRDSFGNQIPTGITGATGPSEFLYRQSTSLGSRATVRGGVGFVRFGPGALVSVPGQNGTLTIRSAEENPLGQAGVSFVLTKKLSVDLNATRSAITYTPVSTRFGVLEDELKGQINYFFDSRTNLHAAYWYGRYSSREYAHAVAVNGTSTYADHDQANGVSIDFTRTVFHSDPLSFDAGYEGVGYGFAGQARNIFLGFFNPSFYQRHEFVPRFYGALWGPLGYDFSAGIGGQQTGRGQPFSRAWDVSPALSVRVSRHLRLVFGYTHYNTAQILGPLRGNAVRFVTEWQY